MSIFLSYSHHDNKDPEKWVTKFHDRLQTRLESLTGEDIRILLDKYDLSGNLVNEGIEEMLQKAQLLIALVSPSYLKKEWCTKERDIFLESIKTRETNYDKPEERLIVAIKLIEFGFKMVDGHFIGSLPDVLRKQRYFEFFSLDKNGNPITMKPEDSDFDIAINDLAHKLVLFLQKLTGQNQKKKCVFIAETSRDLEFKRKSITKELESSGYLVFPTNLLSDNKSDIDEEINYYLKRSIISIHLIGGFYGFTLSDARDSLTKFQYELARQSNIPMLTWMPNNLELVDPDQKLFIEHIKNNISSNNDLIEGSFEDFKIDLFDNIKKLQG